jgi:hypothetical protein
MRHLAPTCRHKVTPRELQITKLSSIWLLRIDTRASQANVVIGDSNSSFQSSLTTTEIRKSAAMLHTCTACNGYVMSRKIRHIKVALIRVRPQGAMPPTRTTPSLGVLGAAESPWRLPQCGDWPLSRTWLVC